MAPIHDAALKCDVEGLTKCLSDHFGTPGMYSAIDANSVQAGGRTALHVLCGSNSAGAAMYVQTGERNAETVEACFHLLREAGADLSARDNAGRTPLHHVADCSSARMIPEVHANWQRGCLQLASLLLHHGADVNATDAQSIAGRGSPLHEAVSSSAPAPQLSATYQTTSHGILLIMISAKVLACIFKRWLTPVVGRNLSRPTSQNSRGRSRPSSPFSRPRWSGTSSRSASTRGSTEQ